MASTALDTFTPSGTPEPGDGPIEGTFIQPIQQIPPLPKWKYEPTQIKFDPAKHLAIEEPAWRKTLDEFGYDNEKDGISPIGATAAFRVFTEEAVHLMRNDLFSASVQENHVYSTKRAPYQVRGFAPEKSQFLYDAWHSPQVLEAMSRAAGIDLVPMMDYEIGHTNIQLGPKGPDGVRDLGVVPSAPLPDNEKLPPSKYDARPVDDWHYDRVPFVAVHMVSDTEGMQGGETAVMGRDGRICIVPGPGLGKVVIMQGSCLKHAALRSLNCPERIAMVTSLRPRDPMTYDMSHMRGVGECSDAKEIGFQWLEYRLKVLEDRLRIQRERLTENKQWNLDSVKAFADTQREYLETTVNELYTM